MPYMLNITAVIFKRYAWEGFPCYFIFNPGFPWPKRKNRRLVWSKEAGVFSVFPMGGIRGDAQCNTIIIKIIDR
jgi:hypothetical protein